MPDQTPIPITRDQQGVVFPRVAITQSQLVFWANHDPQGQAHWPQFANGLQTRTQVGAGNTSDPVQPASGVGSFTLVQGMAASILYVCKIHPEERAFIDVVLDFFSNANQLPDATVNVAYSQALTSGGMPPFTFSLSGVSLPNGLQVVNDPWSGAMVTGTPTQTGDSFSFSMHCEDKLGNAVDQTYLLRVKTASAAGN